MSRVSNALSTTIVVATAPFHIQGYVKPRRHFNPPMLFLSCLSPSPIFLDPALSHCLHPQRQHQSPLACRDLSGVRGAIDVGLSGCPPGRGPRAATQLKDTRNGITAAKTGAKAIDTLLRWPSAQCAGPRRPRGVSQGLESDLRAFRTAAKPCCCTKS